MEAAIDTHSGFIHDTWQTIGPKCYGLALLHESYGICGATEAGAACATQVSTGDVAASLPVRFGIILHMHSLVCCMLGLCLFRGLLEFRLPFAELSKAFAMIVMLMLTTVAC